VVDVPVVWHLDLWKQEVLALWHVVPVGSNLQLVLQHESPLKRETILPLTNLTPGSHCSVPSTIPFPQIPALIGVWVCDGFTRGALLETEIPVEAETEATPNAEEDGVEDFEAPVEKELETEPAAVLVWEAPVEKELEVEAAPVPDCEAPVEKELEVEAAPVAD